MAEIKVILESEDEKTRVELEAKKLGVSGAALFRLLFKNWVGEIKLEKKEKGGE